MILYSFKKYHALLLWVWKVGKYVYSSTVFEYFYMITCRSTLVHFSLVLFDPLYYSDSFNQYLLLK